MNKIEVSSNHELLTEVITGNKSAHLNILKKVSENHKFYQTRRKSFHFVTY